MIEDEGEEEFNREICEIRETGFRWGTEEWELTTENTEDTERRIFTRIDTNRHERAKNGGEFFNR